MKIFKIAIEEMVVDTFEVEANDAEEALQTAIEKYKNGIFVLEPGNVTSRQISIVKPNCEGNEWLEF
jgi:hypothetical protein